MLSREMLQDRPQASLREQHELRREVRSHSIPCGEVHGQGPIGENRNSAWLGMEIPGCHQSQTDPRPGPRGTEEAPEGWERRGSRPRPDLGTGFCASNPASGESQWGQGDTGAKRRCARCTWCYKWPQPGSTDVSPDHPGSGGRGDEPQHGQDPACPPIPGGRPRQSNLKNVKLLIAALQSHPQQQCVFYFTLTAVCFLPCWAACAVRREHGAVREPPEQLGDG